VLQVFKTKTARILAALAFAVVLYAVAGFLIAPRMLRTAMLENIPKTLDAKPTVGEIHINPFLLQLEIKDFALADPSGQKLLGFQRLFIEFEVSSLWHRAYSFANIDIAAPYVNATVAPDGVLNLLKLQPKPQPPKPAAANNAPLPSVRVGSFKVTQGSLSYEDRSRPSEFAARLEPINFELKDFTTGVAGGLFTFTGTSKLGERVEWHGHLSVQPIESDGDLRIDGLRAHTIWQYLEDRLNFAINSGSIDLSATYRFSLRDAIDLHVDVSKVAVTDLSVRPKGADVDWVSIPGLTLTGTSVDLSKRQAHVDSLSMAGVKVTAWLAPDGSLNLLKLAAAPPGPAGTGEAASAAARPVTETAPAKPSAPWQVDLGQFELHDATISAEDRTTQPVAKVVLAPLSLRIGGASLDLAKPINVAFETRINESGSLNVSGDVTPQPLAASLSVKLAGIDLTAIQPYIARQSSMTLRSGRLAAEAKVRYGAPNQKPALQFLGDVHVENLHSVDNALHDDFINWERLDVLGLDYQQAPNRLDIAEVVARKPYARIIIESDSSLNVKRVLAGSGPAAPAGKPAVAAPAAIEQRGSTVAKSTAAGSAPAAPPAMPMAIKKIVVQQGRANFTDLSVAPNFSAGIQNLEGSVLGLSSKPNSRAKVDLHGNVDEFSPVSITGDVNVLSAALYTDLDMDFRNMELSIFNPYSGKFAGYNITKGKLTTELHYKVDGRKLDAQHHIIIDQLEFGDKTASKDAVSLPIKLAVALLRDRNGVIDLNLPVSGSLDDPKFRLAPIIWKVFVNILEKAVTAPFALLGALFGGGPDLQFIDFQPGASALDDAAAGKIKAIVKALNARPQLKIEVPIAVVPDIDRPALVAALFTAQLSATQSAQGSRKKNAPSAVATPFEQLDPNAQLELLARLYTQDLGGEPKYPEAVTSLKQKPEAISAKIEFLSSAIREHLVVGDAELKALGEQRAMALEEALLTDTQIARERVFLVANNKAAGKDGAVRLELSLQ